MISQGASSSRKTELAIDVPTRARWLLDDLITLDGHRLTLTFSASVRALPEPAERKLFQETFPHGSAALDLCDITAHFSPALRSAAAAVANRASAESALTDAFKINWIEALRSAGNAVAFSCGIELLAPFSVEAASSSLQQERLAQMQRTATERQTADRVEHFQRAAELLKQWDALHKSVPTLTPGHFLEQLNPADRGGMLETLLMASAGQTPQPDLWAVAGPYLVRIALSENTPEPQLFPVSPAAGPLRGVQVVDGGILVGARAGVLVYAANPGEAQIYLDPELNSDYGFTQITLTPNGLCACHREGGIVIWRMGDFDRPARVVRPSELGGGPKCLSRAHDPSQVIFAVRERLLCLNSTGKIIPLADMAAPLVAVLPVQEQIVLASEDGAVAILDSRTYERVSETRVAARLSGAAVLPWLTSHRILLTTPDGPIYCIGLDDQLVTQYTGPHIGLREVVGSPAKVAAMSSDRQRILIWNTWDPRRPAAEIYITGLTKHRIADLAFG